MTESRSFASRRQACARTLLLLVAAFLLQPSTGLGGWRCDVCQDVVTTFRLQFPELGARDMGAPISAGGADPEAVVAPAPPGCTAFAKGSTIRSACVGARQGISVEERTRFFVWSSAKAGKAALEVCAELGKCKKLPAIGPTGIREGKTSDDEVSIKCDRASRTARCQLDPNCPAYKAAGCDEVCVSCLWLVQSWPRFSSMCAMEKKGGSSPAAGGMKLPAGKPRFAEAAAGASGSSSLALTAAERIARKRALAAQARAAAAEDAQLRAEEAEAAAELRAAEEEWHAQLELEAAADADSESGAGSGSGSAGAAAADEDEVLQTSAALLQVGESAAAAAGAEGRGSNALTGTPPSRKPGSSTAAAAVPAPAPIKLSDSTFRSTIKPAIIPKGLGSPALESSLLTLPPPDADELGDECMRQFWALASLPEAWSAVATGGADSHLAGYSWDPLTACRCMSKCPYNSIDALAVEEACGGIFEPRAPHLAGKRLLAGLARLKRERAPKAFAAAAGPGEAGELAGRMDTEISRVRDV